MNLLGASSHGTVWCLVRALDLYHACVDALARRREWSRRTRGGRGIGDLLGVMIGARPSVSCFAGRVPVRALSLLSEGGASNRWASRTLQVSASMYRQRIGTSVGAACSRARAPLSSGAFRSRSHSLDVPQDRNHSCPSVVESSALLFLRNA